MKRAEEILKEKKSDLLSVSKDTTIEEALRIMTKAGIGAILVEDGDEYIGIWTERDLMRNILTSDFDLKTSAAKKEVESVETAPI